MFLEIIPELYDVQGRKAYKPHLKKGSFTPTYPFGRYVSRPLSVHCESLQGVRKFLASCKRPSDQEAFGKRDYWLPPDEFEKQKKGDCDDHALWTWRQLMQMGYRARFVAGHCGRYRRGHAWVTFQNGDKFYLAESTMGFIGWNLPRLWLLKYRPLYSVEWNGKEIVFYSHKEARTPLLAETLRLVPEWLWFWMVFWTKFAVRLPRFIARFLLRPLRKQHIESSGAAKGVESTESTTNGC